LAIAPPSVSIQTRRARHEAVGFAMRVTDPFPIPGRGGEPTHIVDWDAIARSIVRDRLKIERNERVILCADPYYGGAMLDALRCELQQARAIELGTILNWTPRLTTLRAVDGCKPDPEDARAEDEAMRDLFACADVYIWLQSDWRSPRATYAVGRANGCWHNGTDAACISTGSTTRRTLIRTRRSTSGSTSSIRGRSSNSTMPRWRATCAPSPTPSSTGRSA
jgi:hypothetical protein